MWSMNATNNDQFILGQSRSRYLQSMVLLLIVISGISAVILIIFRGITSGDQVPLIFTGLTFFVNILAYFMLKRGQVDRVSYIVIAEVMAAMFVTMDVQYWWFMLTCVLSIIISATLARTTLYRIVVVTVLLTVLYVGVLKYGDAQAIGDATPYLVLAGTLGIISISIRYFIGRATQTAQVAANSANLLQAAAATSEIIGKLLKLDELLPQAIDLIRERFAFYHVQIFLLDETGENAQLAASTGSIGQMLFERHHSLPVGSRSVIGRVTSSGQPVTANDTDPFYHRNELLPNTRSELALPIMDGDKIIGALDVQSRRYEIFTTEVIQALQVVANQLGITIRNARLFEEQEKTALDTRRLFLESETNLREIQRLNQQLTRSGWQEYLQTRKPVSGVTLQNEGLSSGAEWSDTLREATLARQSVTSERDGHRIIAVPMVLDNEVIGAIEVEATETTRESDITEMVNAVAQRLALSLDKARLFEESQEATAREQRINDIVTRYQSVNNVDELLRITLQELSQSLGATHSSIRLGTVPVASQNGEGHA